MSIVKKLEINAENFKTIKKEKIVIATTMADVFCEMLKNKMFHNKEDNLAGLEHKSKEVLVDMKKNFENRIKLNEKDLFKLKYAVIASLINVGFNYELKVDYDPNKAIKDAFFLIDFEEDISFFFPFKSGIYQNFHTDDNGKFVDHVQTYNMNLEKKYEIKHLEDSEIDEIKNQINELFFKTNIWS